MKETEPIKLPSHDIGRRAENKIRIIVESTNQFLLKEITGRDYGIDGLLEYFENDRPTGMVALVQIKGTNKEIKKLETVNKISCSKISR